LVMRLMVGTCTVKGVGSLLSRRQFSGVASGISL
jgi:hypothetical protein